MRPADARDAGRSEACLMLLSVRMYFDVYLQWRYLVGVHMKYSELVESGAPTSELQSYLVDSELVTVH